MYNKGIYKNPKLRKKHTQGSDTAPNGYFAMFGFFDAAILYSAGQIAKQYNFWAIKFEI